MKHIKTLILIAIATMLASCIGEPTRSPHIQTYGLAINSTPISNTKEYPVFVGDTLQIEMELYGFQDDLEYFQVSVDREFTNDSIANEEDFLQYCNPMFTNAKEGVYSFNPGIKTMHLTLFLMPKRAKEDTTQPIPVSLALKSAYKKDKDHTTYNLNFNYYIKNKE
jgi:hypothetical protein